MGSCWVPLCVDRCGHNSHLSQLRRASQQGRGCDWPQVSADLARSRQSQDSCARAKRSALRASLVGSLGLGAGRGQTVPSSEKVPTTMPPFSVLLLRQKTEKPAQGSGKASHSSDSGGRPQVHPSSHHTCPQGCSPSGPRAPLAWSQVATVYHRGPAPSAAGSRAGWRLRPVCLGAGSSV